MLTSGPDDPGAQDDTAPGPVTDPFVPSAETAVSQLPPEFVVRLALRADFDVADPADVALVCASAGYGKTLLLAEWARSSTGADVAWVDEQPRGGAAGGINRGLCSPPNPDDLAWPRSSVSRCIATTPPRSTPTPAAGDIPWPYPLAAFRCVVRTDP